MNRKQTQRMTRTATRLHRPVPQTQPALDALPPGNFLLP